MSFAEAGIPEGYTFRKLLCHRTHRFLVVKTSHRAKPHCGSVWVRRFEQKKYTKLCGQVHEGLDYRELILHDTKPLAYVNVWKHAPSKDINGMQIDGFDWHGLETYDLEAKETKTTIKTIPDQKNHLRIWVSDLLSCSGSSDTLLTKIAFQSPVTDGVSNVDYWICDFEPTSGEYERVLHLPHTFL